MSALCDTISVTMIGIRKLVVRVSDLDIEVVDRQGALGAPDAGWHPTPAAPDDTERLSMAITLADEGINAERSSAESLGTRSSWLIGFVGVVLALIAGFIAGSNSQGQRGSLDLGSVGNPAFAIVAALAILLLLAAAFIALRAMRPRNRSRLPRTLLNDLLTGDVTTAHATKLVARMKIDFYVAEAESNDLRGKQLQRALGLLVAGVVMVSGLAGILIAHLANRSW